MQVIAYPHIQTHRLYWPATATAQVLDLKVAPVKVGYIMGSGDQVPEALRRMGVDVTMIDGDDAGDGRPLAASTRSSSASAPRKRTPTSSPTTAGCSTTCSAAAR